MILGGIEMSVLSKLLQGVKKLDTFDFTSSPSRIFDFLHLDRELLRCSRDSLQKLVLHSDCESQRGNTFELKSLQRSALD